MFGPLPSTPRRASAPHTPAHAIPYPSLSLIQAALKQQINTAKGAGFPAEGLKLVFAGKVLKDEATLAEQGVAEASFLVCMVSKPKAAAPAAAVAGAGAPAAPAPVAAPAPAPAPVRGWESGV